MSSRCIRHSRPPRFPDRNFQSNGVLPPHGPLPGGRCLIESWPTLCKKKVERQTWGAMLLGASEQEASAIKSATSQLGSFRQILGTQADGNVAL